MKTLARLLVALMLAAACLVARPALADDVQGSCALMMCCGTECACGDDSCCNNACGISGGGSSGGGGGGNGGLFGALFDAIFNPPPPDPEAVARAEAAAAEAAARRAAALAEAKADYDASVARTTEREARGRDLYAAWVALQNALHDAHDRSVSAEAAAKLLAPLPLRARAPIAAADQASCAAFHSSLALSMGTWRETSAPPMDPTFLDAERIAHEASTVFDRGESIAGCDSMASLALPDATGARAPASDGKTQAAFVAHAVPGLEASARALAEAQRAYEAADAAYREAKGVREKGEVARQAELAQRDKERNDRDGELREDEAKRKAAEEALKKAEPPPWKKRLLKPAELAEVDRLTREKDEATEREAKAKEAAGAAGAAQKAAAEKAKREKEEEEAREQLARERAEADKRALDERKAKLDQEEQAASAAAAALREQGAAKPRPIVVYPSRPRPVRHRRDP